MRRLKLLYLIIIFLPVVVYGQKTPVPTPQSELLIVARQVIIDAGNCALITLDSLSHPRTRTMDPFAPDDDFIIWFGTNSNTRKVQEIRANPQVTLYYFDKPSASYVTISGRAEIVETPEAKKVYWKKAWVAFYPDYPDGYSLIKVIPEWLEVISESRGVTGNPSTWQPPRVEF